MKLDKHIHETHAKRLAAIISTQSTFAPHLNRPEFSTLLKLELNTLAEIEKKLPEDKLEEKLTSTYLVKAFNELTKQEFKLGEKFSFEDDGDLIDNVNYLPTYIKNIFKVDIDDVVGGKKVVAENPNIDLRGKPDIDEGMDGAAAFNMGAMGYGAGPYENPFLMGKAYGKLNKDIAEGKVYQYKTKPKSIIICKWFLLILLGLSILGLIVTSIFCFMAHGLNVHVLFETKTPDTWLNTISNGIFYIICAGFGYYTFHITLKSFLKKKGKVNENSLYQFSWYFYLAYIILALLITLLDLRTTWFYTGVFTITEAAGSSHNIGFWGWKIGIVVTAGLTGACIAPMIIGAVTAPKQDKEKLEQILKDYIDQVVPPSAQAGPEVQKPVDVKPVDEKKDTDKKSDDTKELKS